MIVAFHFRVDSDAGSYGWRIERQFFLHLLAAPREDVHIEIFVGDLLAYRHCADEQAREALLQELLGSDPRRWSTVDRDEFAAALFSSRIYVLAVEGLPRKLQDHLEAQLRRDASYIGALEINPGSRLQWDLYRRSLVARYRYVSGEIRLFYRGFEESAGADVKNIGLERDLKELPFKSVVWEDIGLRHTIFDSYESPDHARRVAELGNYLSEHFTRVADELLLRAAALNPQLNEALYAALRTFERTETAEDCAQVAISCRRFLEGLADALYAPRNATEGRNLGATAYRNRLWAYIEEKLQGKERALLAAQLDDLGDRIDSIDELANKGIHARMDRSAIRRLLVALLIVAYDLFSLTGPPLESSLEPYKEGVVGFARKVIKKGPLE